MLLARVFDLQEDLVAKRNAAELVAIKPLRRPRLPRKR